jgi:4-coumarate--CoA ligase
MLGRAALHRLVCATIAAEAGRLRGPGGRALPPMPWEASWRLDDAGLGLDSLERLGARAALVETFALDPTTHDGGQPARLGALVDWVARGWGGAAACITVRSSGSTGSPRACAHRVADLLAEARYFATLLGDRRRVLALVPAHHLYGLVWTVLLPDVMGLPVTDAGPDAAILFRPGDVVVGVPEHWRAIPRLCRTLPPEVTGISSAGPLGDAGQAVLDAGIGRLLDVYGASEVGGIAVREVPAPAYRLLPRWRLVPDGAEWALADAEGRRVALPDHVAPSDEGQLRLGGRRDGAVQVGGHNVWPDRVAAALRGVAGVADIAVRLGGQGRLKAFLVPEEGADPAAVIAAVERRAETLLTPVERPAAFRIGGALPRDALGKLVDWA